MRRWMLVLGMVVISAASARAERIKDIVTIKGVRGNPLWGYGLVIGLGGTGDGSTISKRALASVLKRASINLTPDEISTKNIASVIVTATLGPFARKGSPIDVTASAIGSAQSLQGGTLLMTPLMGADGQVYAVAQGAIAIGGFGASGEKASVTKNHLTVGRIPNGAIVERQELANFVENGHVTLQLRNPDFDTADRIAKAIQTIYPDSSKALDAGTVRVQVPPTVPRADVTAFLSRIGQLEVQVDQPARVVISERTGTIIVGANVAVSMVAISHGNLSVVRQEVERVSQPGPLATGGTTEKETNTQIDVGEGQGQMRLVPKTVTVNDLTKALNALGVSPRDLIVIFQALKRQGALQADLEIM